MLQKSQQHALRNAQAASFANTEKKRKEDRERVTSVNVAMAKKCRYRHPLNETRCTNDAIEGTNHCAEHPHTFS